VKELLIVSDVPAIVTETETVLAEAEAQTKILTIPARADR